MDQRLFCPQCQGAYEPEGDMCRKCGGAIPDEAWPSFDDAQPGEADAEEVPGFESRPARSDTPDD
jgi:predicted amidophosphoribosyltransferase